MQPVCIGQGVDAFSDGVLATVILPSAIGLFLWVRELYFAAMFFDSNRPTCRYCLPSYDHGIGNYTHYESGSFSLSEFYS